MVKEPPTASFTISLFQHTEADKDAWSTTTTAAAATTTTTLWSRGTTTSTTAAHGVWRFVVEQVVDDKEATCGGRPQPRCAVGRHSEGNKAQEGRDQRPECATGRGPCSRRQCPGTEEDGRPARADKQTTAQPSEDRFGGQRRPAATEDANCPGRARRSVCRRNAQAQASWRRRRHRRRLVSVIHAGACGSPEGPAGAKAPRRKTAAGAWLPSRPAAQLKLQQRRAPLQAAAPRPRLQQQRRPPGAPAKTRIVSHDATTATALQRTATAVRAPRPRPAEPKILLLLLICSTTSTTTTSSCTCTATTTASAVLSSWVRPVVVLTAAGKPQLQINIAGPTLACPTATASSPATTATAAIITFSLPRSTTATAASTNFSIPIPCTTTTTPYVRTGRATTTASSNTGASSTISFAIPSATSATRATRKQERQPPNGVGVVTNNLIKPPTN